MKECIKGDEFVSVVYSLTKKQPERILISRTRKLCIRLLISTFVRVNVWKEAVDDDKGGRSCLQMTLNF